MRQALRLGADNGIGVAPRLAVLSRPRFGAVGD